MANAKLDEYIKNTKEKYNLTEDSDYDSYMSGLKQRTLEALTGNYNNYLNDVTSFATDLGGIKSGQYKNYADYASGIGNQARSTLEDLQKRNNTYNTAAQGLMGDSYDPTNYNKLSNYLTELSDAMGEVERYYKRNDPYSIYSSQDNWDTLSRYTSDKGDAYNDQKWMSMSYGDPKMMYEAVNGNNVQSKYAAKTWVGDQDVYDAMKYMSDYEKQVFNYIYSTQGPSYAAKFLDEIMPTLNEQQRATRTEEAEKWASASPWNKVLASAQSILMSPARGLAYANQLADYALDRKIDQNAGYNKFVYTPNALRSGVSSDMSEAGNFLYQTGMSIGDFLVQAAVSGNFSKLSEGGAKVAEMISLGLMGAGAAADTVISHKDNGMSDAAALALGTIAGAAEIATEKFSIERLLAPERIADGSLKRIIKNALTEGAEEVGSDVINDIADALVTVIAQEEPTKLRQELEAGKSWLYIIAGRLGEQALDFLGGAISGAVMSGASLGVDAARQTSEGRQILGNNGYTDLYNLAMNMPENTAAYQYAQNFTDQAPEGLPTGDFLTRMANEATNDSTASRFQQIQNSRQVGKLAELTDYELGQMTESPANLAKAIQQVRENGKIDAKTFKSIKENEYSRQELGIESRNKATRRAVSAEINERTDALIAHDMKSVENYSKSLGTVGKKVLVDMYKDAARTQFAEDYINDAVQYYDDAVYGREFKYNSDSEINEVQAKAMYEAGLEDLNGGTTNAEDRTSALRSGVQGNDGASSRIGTGGMEEGSGGPQARSETRQGSNLPPQIVRGQEALNTKELGVTRGVDDDSRTLWKVESGETEGMKRVREAAEKRGIKVVWFGGSHLAVEGKDGRTTKARGLRDPETNTIYVRVDHQAFSPEMIGFHELAHDMIDKGEINVEDAAAKLKEIMTPEQFDKMIEDYASLYINKHDENYIWKEIICDAIGGMNSFKLLDKQTTEMRDKYAPVLSSVRETALSTNSGTLDRNTEGAEFSEEIVREYEETGNNLDFSMVTMYDAVGIDAEESMDGQLKVVRRTDGKPLEAGDVDAEYIKNNSAIGTLINAALKSKFISPEDATEQYKAAADLVNTMLRAKDTEMVWAITGATMFSALKKNSDGQYVTTVDFTTVCRKTVAMVNAMSSAMIEKSRKNNWGKGGLTQAEVVRLQKDVAAAGAEVNCPVCYVFSRWAGIGEGLLDEIYDLQEKFDGYTPEQLRKHTSDLRNEIIERAKAEKDRGETPTWATQNNKGNWTVVSKSVERLSQDKFSERENINYKLEQADKGETTLSEKEYNSLKEKRDKLTEEIRILGEWTWTSKIASDPHYKKVPSKVLYDLNAGERFAGEFPVVWSYRTTRGPARGKAILPYSPMRYGDIILGADASKQDRGVEYNKYGKSVGIFEKKTEDRPQGTAILGKDGNFTAKQEKRYESAKARARAQNLIGGHRYQSTSDFRYEYALDYMLSFWELQSLGGKLQTYTKVVEFADIVASIGGDVNISVMPFEKGYDDNGNLVFSSVTGVDIEAAKKVNAKFNNAQLILVGINDEHIRIALDDESGHGGEFIGFVIPYHSSGASKENFIAKLVGNLGEKFDLSYYQDYSSVQDDKPRSDATDAQVARRKLRTMMLTHDKGKISSEMREIFASGKSVDISDRSFEDLRAVEKKALAGDKAAIKEYLSWSAGILNDLYEKMVNGEEKDTFLTSKQAEKIMPHEFWNTKVDRAHAYVNGFIFRSYCFSLGLKPRFTGNNAAKAEDRFGDFSDSKGYWKTLIDRPMYDNFNQPRTQQRINLTRFNNAMLTPEYAKQTYPEYYKDNSKQDIGFEVGRKFVEQNYSEVTDEELIKELDSGETVEVYRSMQIHNGELYPPMSARYKDSYGKWKWKEPLKLNTWYKSDEDPSQITRFVEKDGRTVGKITLDKGNSTKLEDINYNPYNHSTRGPLNDQFASAYSRPELVLVKALVPKSELNSENPYWAQYANDPVGEIDWNEGPVSKQLDKMGRPRKVILSQYIKITQILTPAEQARLIAEELKDVDVPIPVNTVTSAVRTELEKLGVKLGPPAGNTANKFYRMNPDVNFSEESDRPYAPTFYSKLEREVENFKGDKIGASSAVQYLKGKGVKDEEIKWSGINTFLEGKKSVSKAELLDFLRNNQLEIAEQTNYASPFGGSLVNNYTGEVYDNFAIFLNAAKEEMRSVNIDAKPDDLDIKITDDGEVEARYMGKMLLSVSRENPARWSAYSTEGGYDYREILFRIPGSNYSNTAMSVHWNRPGVVAHARVQTFTTDGDEGVLFVDEIQSDWHNEGAEAGYEPDNINEIEDRVAELEKKLDAELDKLDKLRYSSGGPTYKDIDHAFNEWKTYENTAFLSAIEAVKPFLDDAMKNGVSTENAIPDELKTRLKTASDEDLRLKEEYEKIVKEYKRRQENINAQVDVVEKIRKEIRSLNNQARGVPNAPFKATYTEYVLKNLLRLAAEEGDSYLAWTTGKMQEKRWSHRYAEGYRIEYDQQIPSFLKRHGKQWGAKLTEITLEENGLTVPAIEITDDMRESVLYSGQPMFSEANEELEDLYQKNQDLKKQVSELRNTLRTRTEQKEYWKDQTKVTNGPTLRKEDIKRVVKELQKEYNSDADISKDLKKLGENVRKWMRNKDLTDAEALAKAKDDALEVAQKLLSGSKVLKDGGLGETYAQIRDTLKKNRVYVSKETQDGIYNYQDFRKSMLGTLTLTSDPNARSVEDLYAELRDTYGEYLFPKEFTSTTNQLDQIQTIVNDFRPVYEGMNTFDIANAVDYVSDELIERVMAEDVRQIDPTIADKIVARTKEKYQTQANEAIMRARIQRERTIHSLKQHYAKVAMDKKIRRANSEARQKLLKIARRLNNTKLPAVGRAYLDQIIGDLDLISVGITASRIIELRRMKEAYEKLQTLNPLYENKDIEEKISRLSKRSIKDMTQEEVADLTEVLLSFEHEYRTYKKAIESQMRHDYYVAGVATMGNIKNSAGPGSEILDKYITTQTLTPEREVHRLTGYVDDDPLYILTKELSGGQRKAQDYTMRAYNMFTDYTNNKKFMERITGKKAEEIKISGINAKTGETEEVLITPAMRIAMYLHSLNEDNMRHIEKGGLNIPDIKEYKKGNIDKAYTDRLYRFTMPMIRQIMSNMTAEERAFAKQINKYFNTMSRDEINETSEKLVGYSIANVENYFPIVTDKSYLAAKFDEMEAMADNGSVANLGFTKERVKASNPIMLYDVTTALNQSISMHAKYVGLAIPVRNFRMLWNEHQGLSETVQGDMKAKWGSRAVDYVKKMMQDVQMMSFQTDVYSDAFAKLRSRYAAAVLSLNASVAMKQAASYPNAAAVVGWAPLMKALRDNKKVNTDLIAKYTPDYWYRARGFSTQELAEIVKQGMSLPPLLNWIQAVDLAVTKKLWTAAEYYIQETTNLTVGTDDYYKQVATVYNRIIEETQPNYTAMQRPQVLRSTESLTRALNMFKTQPFQNFNVLYDAIGNYRAKARQYMADKNDGTKAALDIARKNMVNAISSQAVSALVFALMQYLWDRFRKKDDKYANKDGELTFASRMKGIGITELSSAAGMVPFGGTLLEFGESLADTISKELGGKAVFNQSFYGLSENATESVNDALSTVIKLVGTVGDAVKKESTAETFVRSIVDMSADVAQFAGIPANNVINLAAAIAGQAAGGIGLVDGGQYVSKYNSLRIVADPEKNKSAYYDVLYQAYKNDRDQYKTILDNMKKEGFEDDKIKTNMEKRMKKDQGVNSVKDLSERWLPD